MFGRNTSAILAVSIFTAKPAGYVHTVSSLLRSCIQYAIELSGCGTGAGKRFTDSINQYVIGRQIAILEDTDHQFRTLADVLPVAISKRFVASKQQMPNRGFSTADYWVRFDLTNKSVTTQDWLLEIGFGNFSEIDLYFVSTRTGRVVHKRGGELLGRQAREISYHTYLFYSPIQPNDPQRVYIRLVSTFGQATFPLYIWREDAFIHSAQVSGVLWGLYYGFLVSVFLYHLFLLLFNHEKNYLLLTIYLAAYILYELTRGYCVGVRFLWPGHIWLLTHGLATAFYPDDHQLHDFFIAQCLT